MNKNLFSISDIEAKVAQICQSIQSDDNHCSSGVTTLDELDTLEAIMELEEYFSIIINDKEGEVCNSLSSLAGLVSKKLKEQGLVKG